MNKHRIISVVALLFSASLSSIIAPSSHASILGGALVNGTNTLQDQSFEQLFDQNNNGLFDAGDVIVGGLRIDDALPKGTLFSNSLYAIFSVQVGSVVPVPVGAQNIYQIQLVPTPAGTLALDTSAPANALLGAAISLGGLGVAGAPVGSAAALYERVGGFVPNMVSTAPPDVGPAGPDIRDFTTNIITTGTLDLVAGFTQPMAGTRGAGGEFMSFLTSVFPAGPAPSIAALKAATTATQIGSYSQALNVLLNKTADIVFNRTVPVTDVNGGPGAIVDLGVALGSVTGSSNATYTNAGGTYAPTFRDSQQFITNVQIVPEPITLVVWGGLSALGIVFATFRRKSF
jgi:hypothetical protein